MPAQPAPAPLLTATGLQRSVGGGEPRGAHSTRAAPAARCLWRGVDLALAPGDILFLRGPSGVGKTLLLRMLACLDVVEAGQLRLHGRSPSEVGIPCWRAEVMYVHQQRVSYAGTPNQLLARVCGFASQRRRHKQQQPPLPQQQQQQQPQQQQQQRQQQQQQGQQGQPQQQPLSHQREQQQQQQQQQQSVVHPDGPCHARLAALLPQLGLEAGVAEQPWAQLSGGQAQRVSLALALALGPSVLLLDEPTSACDQGAARRVEAVLRAAAATQRCGIVWVTHDEQQPYRVGGKVLTLPQGTTSSICCEADVERGG